MKINDYVLVTNNASVLYKRRCKIVEIVEKEDMKEYVVYSEGLEEQDTLQAADLELSKF